MSRLPPAAVTIACFTPPAKCGQQQHKKKTETLHGCEALTCFGLKIPKSLCVLFFMLFPCFLFSRQCAVPAYKISKHQESKQSFEIWCTLLFKLRAIEANACNIEQRTRNEQVWTQDRLPSKETWPKPRTPLPLTRTYYVQMSVPAASFLLLNESKSYSSSKNQHAKCSTKQS